MIKSFDADVTLEEALAWGPVVDALAARLPAGSVRTGARTERVERVQAGEYEAATHPNERTAGGWTPAAAGAGSGDVSGAFSGAASGGVRATSFGWTLLPGIARCRRVMGKS